MGIGLVLGLLVDAAIIGIVVAALENRAFPGWGPMLGCVLLIGVASAGAGILLPEGWELLAIVAGAAVGAFAISWLCDMTLKRGAIAAGIYLGVRLLIGLAFAAIAAA